MSVCKSMYLLCKPRARKESLCASNIDLQEHPVLGGEQQQRHAALQLSSDQGERLNPRTRLQRSPAQALHIVQVRVVGCSIQHLHQEKMHESAV